MPLSERPLIFVHVGDLHVTTAAEQNHRDLDAIVDEIAHELTEQIDFVYLPGDNADNGLPDQYALVRDALSRLTMPVHVVTGDHDMEPKSLDNFYAALGADPLPKAIDVSGVRCLFLDMSGPGGGGPDFRIGAAQRQWLESELRDTAANGARCAIFMHTYPDDLKGEGETEAVNAALAAREVLLVEMGHTHYNELANDGRTIFAATRSTGQIEEGPVGYAIVTIDDRAVSWRFKALAASFPQVLITAPADRRLATDAMDRDHIPGERCELRATILGRTPVTRCVYRLDGGGAQPLEPVGNGRFVATVQLPEGVERITVEAEDAKARTGSETIELARPTHLDVARHADGSDRDAIGAWPERGIPGGQLGPNRNGRAW